MSVIGVDVDLTVVRTDRHWFEWNNRITGKNLTFEGCLDEIGFLPYDVSSLYPGIDKQRSYDYWRQHNLYDSILPMEGSVEALRTMHEQGNKIVFVSALKGDHHKSKFNFLKRYFPFMDGFIGTKEKQYARVDILIDDRNKNLVGLNGACPIKFNTPYDQEIDINFPMFNASSWEEILQLRMFNGR